jgi:hypothetical protein
MITSRSFYSIEASGVVEVITQRVVVDMVLSMAAMIPRELVRAVIQSAAWAARSDERRVITTRAAVRRVVGFKHRNFPAVK